VIGLPEIRLTAFIRIAMRSALRTASLAKTYSVSTLVILVDEGSPLYRILQIGLHPLGQTVAVLRKL
jgi:hypothetical protein